MDNEEFEIPETSLVLDEQIVFEYYFGVEEEESEAIESVLEEIRKAENQRRNCDPLRRNYDRLIADADKNKIEELKEIYPDVDVEKILIEYLGEI